jgi:ABC-type uncharacterized transport system auxiliary subunit
MRFIIALVAAATLAGCTPTTYVKDGITQDEVNRDTLQCRYEAESSVATMRNEFDRAFRTKELMASCMQARGYVRQS